MSSEPILKYGKANRKLWGDCCTYDRPEQLLMLNKGTSFIDCNACDTCPIEISGFSINGAFVLLNTPLSSFSTGTYTLSSINIAIGSVANLFLQGNGILISTTVTSVVFSGTTVSVPPVVPFDVIGSIDIAFATLNTSTLGAKSVTIQIQTICGTVSFVQPYVVI